MLSVAGPRQVDYVEVRCSSGSLRSPGPPAKETVEERGAPAGVGKGEGVWVAGWKETGEPLLFYEYAAPAFGKSCVCVFFYRSICFCRRCTFYVAERNSRISFLSRL